MQRPLRLLAAIAAASLALAGCVPGDGPAPTPSPTATATAVFASEEEALAAAEEVYRAYMATMVEITHDGGAAGERLAPYVTDTFFASESAVFARYQESRWIATGEISPLSMTIQRANIASGDISAYVCNDYTTFDILDSSGASVVSSDRPDLVEFVVRFEWDRDLKVADQWSWLEGGVCP